MIWTPASGAEGRAAVVSTGAQGWAPWGQDADLATGLQPTPPEPPGSDLQTPRDQGKLGWGACFLGVTVQRAQAAEASAAGTSGADWGRT